MKSHPLSNSGGVEYSLQSEAALSDEAASEDLQEEDEGEITAEEVNAEETFTEEISVEETAAEELNTEEVNVYESGLEDEYQETEMSPDQEDIQDKNEISDANEKAPDEDIQGSVFDATETEEINISEDAANGAEEGESEQGSEEDTSAAVTITDENLRKAIAQNLGVEYTEGMTITENMMAKLTKLNAPNAGILDLNGLEYAENLEELDLSGNDLSQKANGNKQIPLFVLGNAMNNRGMTGWPNIKKINLSGTKISGLTANMQKMLTGSPKLEELDLSENNFTGIWTWTAAIPNDWENLKVLDFSSNGLTGIDFTGSFRLDALEKADLSKNRIYFDENTGDWVNTVIAIGASKFDFSDPKSYASLECIYIKNDENRYVYVNEADSVIDLGYLADDDMTMCFKTYMPNATVTGKLKTADGQESTALIGGKEATFFSIGQVEFDNVLKLDDLAGGVELTLTFYNGDSRTYTLKATRTTVPGSTEETSAGVKDVKIQKAVCGLIGEDAATHVLTKVDMADSRVTRLTLKNVTDVSGLEYAGSLTSLSLTGTFGGTVDVSQMKSLTSLTLNGQFDKVTGLENLTKLTTLSLEGNFAELENFDKLTALKRTVTIKGALKTAADLTMPDAVTYVIMNAAEDKTLPKGKYTQFNSNWGAGLDLSSGSPCLSQVTIHHIEDQEFAIPEIPTTQETLNVGILFSPENTEARVIDCSACNATLLQFNNATVEGLTLKGSLQNCTSLTVGGLTQVYDTSFSAEKLTSLQLSSLLMAGTGTVMQLPKVSQAPRLQTINAVNGGLAGEDGKLPKELEKFKELKILYTNDKNLKVFDIDLSGTDLEDLNLSASENLSGTIDADLLPDTLTKMWVNSTKIEGFTGDWSCKTELSELNINSCYLREWPAEMIRALSGLKKLLIYKNLYSEIPANAFDNSSSLQTLEVGAYLKLFKQENGTVAPDPESETGKAIAKLQEVSPAVKIKYYQVESSLASWTASYASLYSLEAIDAKMEGNVMDAGATVRFIVPTDAKSVSFTADAIVADTKIIVDGKTYKSGDTITVPLLDETPEITVECVNDFAGPNNVSTTETYTIRVVRGGYLENFVPEEGKVYLVAMSVRKVDGVTTSMSAQFYNDAAEVRYQDGKYDVRITTNAADMVTNLVDGERISVNGTDATYRYWLNSLDEVFPFTMCVAPMNNELKTAYIHFDTTKVLDITASAGVDKAVLSAAIARAEEVTAKVEEARNIYTKESYDTMLAALDAAKEVNDLKKPTQNAINEQAEALNTAVDALVIDDSKRADKTSLEEALANAKALTKGNHTDTNWEALQEAIADAQAVYDDLYASNKEAESAAKYLSNAIKAFNSSGEASTLDPANLEDGVYTVYVDMINASNPDQKSMSDGAITKPVTLTVKDGKYTVTANFHGIYITLGEQSFFGYMKELSYWDANAAGGTGEYVPVTVDSTYDVVDEYNDADKDEKADYLYPHQMSFPLVNKSAGDDENGFVHVQVFVPIMESISAGSGTQQALMKIDWTSLAEGDKAANEAIKAEAAANELSKAISEALSVSNTNGTYTANSYQALTEAVKEAQALIKTGTASADELKAAMKKVNDARAALVKTSGNGSTGKGNSSSGDKTSVQDTSKTGAAKTTSAKTKVVKGKTYKVSGQKYKVTKVATTKKQGTVTFTKAKNAKKVTVPKTVKLADKKTYKVTVVGAKAFTGKKIRTVTVGANVTKLSKNAFKSSKATKVILKTKKLKKSSVKASLKGSKVKTVSVKVGTKKVNKTYVKKYKKIFTKKIAGKKVTIK